MFWPVRNLSYFFIGMSAITVPGAIAVILELFGEYDPEGFLFWAKVLLVMAIPVICIALAISFWKLYKCLCEESYSVFMRTENKK